VPNQESQEAAPAAGVFFTEGHRCVLDVRINTKLVWSIVMTVVLVDPPAIAQSDQQVEVQEA
jgi:hypothetical protein